MRDLKYLAFALVLGSACCSPLAGQQPPHCAQVLFCLFNQKAAATDPAGIHKYSEDLIGLIVPNPAGEDSIRRLTSHLADRLASAEQAARAGRGKLAPEKAVVKAFNDLMQEVGAPPSMRASEASLHGFREHAASLKAFPALFSTDRNGTNCNPGEAVFLLYILVSDNGALYKRNLDSAQILTQRDFQQDGDRGAVSGGIVSFGVVRMISGSSASGILSSYSSHHNRNATIALFNNLASTLAF